MEQMAYIDRNILRMAIFEFAIDGQTPVKVAINEAVELAKTFGGTDGHKYVNGVLNGLASELRAREVQADIASGKVNVVTD